MHMYISIVTMFLFAYSHTVVLGREYYCNKFLSVCICLCRVQMQLYMKSCVV